PVHAQPAMRRPTPASVASLPPLVCCGLGILADDARAQTLKAVKDRGTLVCGVSRGILGFSSPGADSTWTGFDVDFCRALAAAIFDDAGKVKFVPLDAAE